MGAFGKLFTALRGGVNEAAEAVADTQAIRILEQEMRDADVELRKSEEALTTIIAKQKLAEQKINDLQKSIDEHEGYAEQALAKGDEGLALEVAEKIAELQNQMATEQEFLDQFKASAAQLRKSTADAKQTIRSMKQQIDTVKATEAVQKAQTAVSSRHLGANSKMKTASESLARIKEKQKLKQAELSAAKEMAADESGESLKEKLKSAGIGASSANASDILARIKAKS